MAKPMSKSQIVAHLAKSTGASKKTVQLFLDELLKLAIREVRGKSGTFIIPNFAQAVRMKRHRKLRMGRNPATGEALNIGAATLVQFRVHTAFAKAVRGNYPGPRRSDDLESRGDDPGSRID
jgi:DNA-binding protein HU-beta